MSTLPILPGTAAVVTPVAGAVAVATAKTDASVFAGILKAVTEPEQASGDAPRRGRKDATDEKGEGSVRPATADGAATASSAAPALDIAALAQAALLLTGSMPMQAAARDIGTPAAADVDRAPAARGHSPVTGPKQGTGVASSPVSATSAKAAVGEASGASGVAAGAMAATTTGKPPVPTVVPVGGAPETAPNNTGTPAPGRAPVSRPEVEAAAGDQSRSPVASAMADVTTEPAATTGAPASSGLRPVTQAEQRPVRTTQSSAAGTSASGLTKSAGAPTSSVRTGQGGGNSQPATDNRASGSGSGGRGTDASPTVATAAPADPVSELLTTLGSPAQQVAGALRTLVTETRAAQAVTAPVADVTAVTVPAGSGLKSLTVQLNPDHLGPVSITLRLQAGAMDIRIAVSTPQALHQLEADKHVLSAAVAALGGAASDLQLGSSAGGSPSGGQAQSNPDRSGGFPSDTASTGRQASGQGRPHGAPQQRSNSDDTTAPSPGRVLDDGLYL